jgi:hypothetical protein
LTLTSSEDCDGATFIYAWVTVFPTIVTQPTFGVAKEIASLFHGGKVQLFSRSIYDLYGAFYSANPIHQARFDGMTNILGGGTPF